MIPPNKPNKSRRRVQRIARWVTFLVLFSFVMGSVIIGGLSFRSGSVQKTPSPVNTPGPSPSLLDEVKRWEEAVKLNPKDPFSLRNLARAQLERGNLPAARSAVDRAMKLSPGDLLNFELAGQIALREGKADQAIGYFKKVVGFSPHDPVLLFELAQALDFLAKPKEAKKYFKEIISIRPNSMEGIRARLFLLKQAMYEKQYGKAEEQAMALHTLFPKDSEILVRLGEIFEQEKKFSQAILYYEKARSNRPKDLLLSSHLAGVYSKAGKPEQAAALWTEVIQKNANDPEPKFELALIDKKLGKKNEAKDLLERALNEAKSRKNQALQNKVEKELKDFS